MIAIDSSVAVPALSAGHPDHVAAHALVAAERPSMPAHAALETYAVLTRLPAPVGLSPETASQVVLANFGDRLLHPKARTVKGLIAELAGASIGGGAVYDALIAVTARDAGATLVTNDRRAKGMYERLDVPVRFLGED